MEYKLLVTGSEGFLGRELVRQAKLEGAEVIRTTSREAAVKADPDLVLLDVTSKKQLEDTIARFKPDYIVHLAGLSFVVDSETHPLAKKINYDSVINLLRATRLAMKRIDGYHPSLVFYSSIEVYGEKKRHKTISETSRHRPTNEYGKMKSMAEKYFISYVKKHNIAGIVIQHGQTIGIGQNERFFIPTIVHQVVEISLHKANPKIKTGPVSHERTLIDTRDGAAAVLKLMKMKKVGEKYLVCGDDSVTLKSIVDKLINLSGLPIKHEIADIGRFPGENIRYSNQKTKEAVNWSPKFSLDQTLKDILEHELSRQ